MKAMVDSGQVRIEIRGFSPGSVVVTFSIIFTPNQSQDIKNVSIALLNSLMNSSKYTVDKNNTSIKGTSLLSVFETEYTCKVKEKMALKNTLWMYLVSQKDFSKNTFFFLNVGTFGFDVVELLL